MIYNNCYNSYTMLYRYAPDVKIITILLKSGSPPSPGLKKKQPCSVQKPILFAVLNPPFLLGKRTPLSRGSS